MNARYLLLKAAVLLFGELIEIIIQMYCNYCGLDGENKTIQMQKNGMLYLVWYSLNRQLGGELSDIYHCVTYISFTSDLIQRIYFR